MTDCLTDEGRDLYNKDWTSVLIPGFVPQCYCCVLVYYIQARYLKPEFRDQSYEIYDPAFVTEMQSDT